MFFVGLLPKSIGIKGVSIITVGANVVVGVVVEVPINKTVVVDVVLDVVVVSCTLQ